MTLTMQPTGTGATPPPSRRRPHPCATARTRCPCRYARRSRGRPAWRSIRCCRDTGTVTLDSGFGNTAACTSAITYIDGDEGILRYRGYPIEQLAQHASFLEVAHLLIYGELPTRAQLDDFGDRIKIHTLLREEMRRFFDGFPRDAHPMAVLSSAVSALSEWWERSGTPATRSRDWQAYLAGGVHALEALATEMEEATPLGG